MAILFRSGSRRFQPSRPASRASRPVASTTTRARQVSVPPPARAARTPTARPSSIKTSRTVAPWRTSAPFSAAFRSIMASKSDRKICHVLAHSCSMVWKK